MTIAIGGIATVAISSTSGVSASSPDTARSARSSNVKIPMEPRAGFRQAEAALTANGYSVDLTMRLDRNCASHSYGEVHAFFESNPCRWLARAYLPVSEGNQTLALVAISWADMRNISAAKTYKHVVDAPGTGNVTELSRETGAYQKVRFNGQLYNSGRKGSAVWNIQVQPIEPTPTVTLNAILSDSRQ